MLHLYIHMYIRVYMCTLISTVYRQDMYKWTNMYRSYSLQSNYYTYTISWCQGVL